MIEGYDFVTAYFIDNDKKIICSLWKNSEDKIIENIIEADVNQSTYKQLTNYITLDQLHENTYNNIKAIEKASKKASKNNKIDLSMQNVFKLFFGEFNEEKESQNLFELKLLIFEMPEVKNSQDRATKSKLRKAKDFKEALIALCHILEESTSETTDPQTSTDIVG